MRRPDPTCGLPNPNPAPQDLFHVPLQGVVVDAFDLASAAQLLADDDTPADRQLFRQFLLGHLSELVPQVSQLLPGQRREAYTAAGTAERRAVALSS